MSITLSDRHVLLFCPEALIVPHFAAMLTIGLTLRELGARVGVSFCFGLQERCVSKAGSALPVERTMEEAKSLCNACAASWAQRMVSAGLPAADLRAVINAEVAAIATGIVDACAHPASLTYEGVAFGKLCFFDLALERKVLPECALDETATWVLRKYLITALTNYLAADRLFQTGAYTDLLVYELYSPNTAVVQAAIKNNINWRIVTHRSHLAIDRRRYFIQRSIYNEIKRTILDWPKWRDLALTPSMVREAFQDSLLRMRGIGSHTYSPGKSVESRVHEQLGLSLGRRLIVAYTTSPDEKIAGELLAVGMGEEPFGWSHPKFFPTQIDWLRWMLDFMRRRDDLQLVIRVHPREDSNKRDSMQSQNLLLLRELLAVVPPNVVVVWPRDPVSSYDLCEAADLVLHGGSTTGLESARLGVPVLSASNHITFCPLGDFMAEATSGEEFENRIDALLAEPPNFERIRLAVRWYAQYVMGTTVNFTDVVPHPNYGDLPPFRLSQYARDLAENIFTNITALDRNHARLQAAQSPALSNAELAQLRFELRHLLHFLMTGVELMKDYVLILRPAGDEGEPAIDPALPEPRHWISCAEGFCRYTAGGVAYAKYSPMTVRLALLSAQVVA